MTDHLPECDYERQDYRGNDNRVCYCSRLRACEQRVREAENRNVIGSVSLAAIGEANVQQYHRGYDAGLDAAREAVAGVKKFVEFPGQPVNYIHPDFFLAAIDALKEKP